MAGNIGEAIGLGFRQPNDSSNARAFGLIQYAEEKKAADAKKKEGLITMKDFVVTDKDLLPAYAKKIAEVRANAINEQAAAVQAGDMNAVYTADTRARQEVAALRTKNAQALQYIQQDPSKFVVDKNIVYELTRPDSTEESLAAKGAMMGDFAGFDGTGTIYYQAIPVPSIDKHFSRYETEESTDASTGRVLPGTTQKIYTKAKKPTEASISLNAQSLLSDKDWTLWATATDPYLRGLDPENEEQQKIINRELEKKALQISRAKAPAIAYEEFTATIERPDKDGSGKSTIKPPSITYNVPFPGQQKGVYPMQANIPSDVVSLTTDKSFINEATGKPYTSKLPTDINPATSKEYGENFWEKETINFKPTTMVVRYVDGKPKAFVRGSVVTTTAVEDGQNYSSTSTELKRQEQINVLVPFEQVSSSIRNKWDLTEWDAQFDELVKKGSVKGGKYKYKSQGDSSESEKLY